MVLPFSIISAYNGRILQAWSSFRLLSAQGFVSDIDLAGAWKPLARCDARFPKKLHLTPLQSAATMLVTRTWCWSGICHAATSWVPGLFPDASGLATGPSHPPVSMRPYVMLCWRLSTSMQASNPTGCWAPALIWAALHKYLPYNVIVASRILSPCSHALRLVHASPERFLLLCSGALWPWWRARAASMLPDHRVTETPGVETVTSHLTVEPKWPRCCRTAISTGSQ